MQIDRMNKGQWGKIRAFFDVRTEEGFVVKGFKIVEGSSGPFVGMPSQKNPSGEYFDSVTVNADLKTELTRLAMETYGSEIVQAPDIGAPEPPASSDDDIPF